ncbi:MAG: SIR2 family protein [Cyclobacteriaceae bacterium]
MPNFESTEKDLGTLAEELAANYLQASRLDLDAVEGDKNLNELKNNILLTRFDNESYSRNILVIGAGCSTNAYDDIPLASKAIDKIHKQITVGHPRYENFKDLVDHYKDEQKQGVPPNSVKDFHLADGVGSRYIDEYRKLILHSPDYTRDDADIDFETSLNLLAKVIPISRVRELIKSLYDHRHGPMMFYELVAHLFKHRFIDAIINFNFDEYLDQSIHEELGSGGYDEILSDGDCRPITELSTKGRLRQPLYIKPHGTASHKSTMRFTKDQYYELPLDMRVFISDLISCRKEKEDIPGKRYVNLITVGFEMKSLEFNEILNASLPKDSNLFSFYYHDTDTNDAETVEKVKRKLYDTNLKLARKRGLEYYFIGHEYFREKASDNAWSFGSNTPTLGLVFLKLFKQIRSFYISPYQPRRVSRHELLPTIFGGEVFNQAFQKIGKETGEELAAKRKEYFESAIYFKDRLVIEVLLAITKNKGRLDLPLLMMGRVGEYYSLYTSAVTEEAEKVGIKPEPTSMMQLINDLFKSDTKADRLTLSDPIVTDDPQNKLDELFKDFTKGSLLSPYLTEFFKQVEKSEELRKFLMKKMMNIFKSNRSNIKSMLRSTIHHVFEKYSSTNLLNTDLSIDLHFYESLQGHNHVNEIRMIAESGNKLASFLDVLMRRSDISVKLVLADSQPGEKNFEEKKFQALKKIYLRHYNNFNIDKARFEDDEIRKILTQLNIELKFLKINRHNHHMVLFSKMNGDGVDWNAASGVNRGIYYFQQGLSENINPIRIVEKTNLRSLHTKFDEYWKSAIGDE